MAKMDVLVTQKALRLPERQEVLLKMTNLRLDATGVFSNVYRGTLQEPEPRREIALKKTWPETYDPHNPKINVEIIMLLALSRDPHRNIVQVLFTFQSKSDRKVCESMVFDFLPTTLGKTIRELHGPPTNMVDIKLYTWQLFNGLYYLLRKRICHRDIKPQNILLDPEAGILKIADFGSAKHMADFPKSSAYQVTRFYRPPELLLESEFYGCLVDVWSAGCCVGEMMRGEVLFPGNEAKHQLKLVMQALGSPTEADIIAMKAPTRLEGPQIAPRGLDFLLPRASKDAIMFLQRILVFNPRNRLYGRELLTDSFFAELWKSDKKRANGKFILEGLMEDLNEMKHGRRRTRRHSHSSVVTAQPLVPDDIAKTTEKGTKQNSKEVVTASEEGTKLKRRTGSRHAAVSKSKELIVKFVSRECAAKAKSTECVNIHDQVDDTKQL